MKSIRRVVIIFGIALAAFGVFSRYIQAEETTTCMYCINGIWGFKMCELGGPGSGYRHCAVYGPQSCYNWGDC